MTAKLLTWMLGSRIHTLELRKASMTGFASSAALVPWLDPETIITTSGGWALLVVSLIIFAETGLLVGFIFPGDTRLVIAGLLTHTSLVFGVNVWIVGGSIAVAAFLGGELGYYIGKKTGPPIFERRETGLFSKQNVERTMWFFDRYGPWAVVVARFVPIVRTFAPVAAGVGRMSYRRYSLYNILGAALWAYALTLLGYAVGYVPWIRDLITQYIDLILLGIVVGSLALVGLHYLRQRSLVRRAQHTADIDTTND